MGISKYNSEGYHDPTVYEALSHIEKEEKARRAFLDAIGHSPLLTLEDENGIIEYRDERGEKPLAIHRNAEYLGDKDGPQWGKSFYTTSNDDIIVDRNFNPYCDDIRYEGRISDEIDSFHDGWNSLEEIDGVLYEVAGKDYTMIRIRKKAYLSFEEALNSLNKQPIIKSKLL